MDKYMDKMYGKCSDKELLCEALEVINSLYEGDRLPKDLEKYSATISSLSRLLNYGVTRAKYNKITKKEIDEEMKRNEKLYRDLADL